MILGEGLHVLDDAWPRVAAVSHAANRAYPPHSVRRLRTTRSQKVRREIELRLTKRRIGKGDEPLVDASAGHTRLFHEGRNRRRADGERPSGD